ncbi:amidase domain-containing protein [Streptomyces mirabilis]|uniref:amidase domain-containing protein n=1 Tax=Streptomyces mirabilis TaxID=68239 RepID=UPI00364943A6
MATYAEKYWKNYNTAYRKFNGVGGDYCTNFVSQSVSRTLCVPVVSRLFGRGVAVCGHRPVVRTSG